MERTAPTKTHIQMVNSWKKDPKFIGAYDELDTEFTLLREFLSAEVAKAKVSVTY